MTKNENITEIYKYCNKCKELRVKEFFNKDKSRPDNKYPYCMLCTSIHNYKYYQLKKLKREPIIEEETEILDN